MSSAPKSKLPSTAKVADAPPPVLLPYQQRWVADDSPFKIMQKGRRTGVTWAEAADNVLIAASDKSAGGQNVYYVGTDKEMTEEYIDACAMWARAFNHAAGEIEQGIWEEGDEKENVRTFTIRFPRSGHKIIALASRPRKLRGRQGVLVGDEGAFQDYLPELIKAAMAFLIWGGKVRIISTHDGEDNPFNELVNDVLSGKRKGTVHTVAFRDAVREGLYKRVCMRMGREWSAEAEEKWVSDTYAFYGSDADEELDVVPAQGSGVYLPRALIERCMDPGLSVVTWSCEPEFTYASKAERDATCLDWCEENILPLLQKLDPIAAKYYGSDFARSGDASVILPGVEDAHLNVSVPFVVEMRRVPFEQQKQVLAYVVQGFGRLMAGAMDASGNGAEMAEWAAQQWGSTTVAEIKLSQEWYRQHMPRLKAAFEDGTIRLPKHADVLADLRAIKKERGIAKVPDNARSVGSDGNKRHGDIAVALALLLYAIAEMEPTPIEFETIGARSTQSALSAFDGTPVHYMPETDSGWGGIPGGNDFGGFD